MVRQDSHITPELHKQYMRDNAKFIEQSLEAGNMIPCHTTPAQPKPHNYKDI